ICYDTIVKSISILVKPNISLQTNIGSVNCAPFTFSAVAPAIINEQVTWYINDTTINPSLVILNGAAIQYTFNNPGTFIVKMYAINAAGCKDSVMYSIVVKGTPNANFTPTNFALCNRDTTISYINTSTYNDVGAISYRWLVNGIQLATSGNFSYRYQLAPSVPLPYQFTTQLIATNSVGCSDTAVGYIQMNPTARASFNISNPNTCVPFIPLVNNGSSDATFFKWYLNGILVDTARVPTFVISLPSTSYTVMLIASNVYNCKPDTSLFTFVSRIKPKAIFDVNDTLGCTGFLNVVTRNNSQHANTYKWDWGDNSPFTTFSNPTHLYNTVGHYLITLVASDGVCYDTTSRMITVSNKPVVNFSANNSTTCDSARVLFTNLTTNANTYLWTFSNGYSSSAQNPSYIFSPSNTPYTIKLVASNSDGCSDSLIKANLITAIIPPAADFVITPSAIISIPNYSFTFQNLTLDRSEYRYLWNLGDGTNSSSRDVTHLYNDTGSYRVQLIVVDMNTSCTDTIFKVARIEGQPGYLYVPNAFYPNSLQNQFRFFRPLGKGIAEYKFQIFDAWGKLLYESTKLDAAGSPVEGWDGTFKGVAMPQDAYAWRITARFRNGKQWSGMAYNNNMNGAPAHTFGTVTLFR
ncbi:MAG: PKD domain-containing protein, partial [Ferruginibacter sp.]